MGIDGCKDNKVIKTIVKMPSEKLHLEIELSNEYLVEEESYDVAALRIKVLDQNDNLMHFYSDALDVNISGPIELIGPKNIVVRGGMTGTYIKTIGEAGEADITIGNSQIGFETIKVSVDISSDFGGMIYEA